MKNLCKIKIVLLIVMTWQALCSQTISQLPNEPDLSVRYIKRLPEINYVWGSTNPTVDGWPTVGQIITWRVHIKNWSPNTYTAVSYQWKKNNVTISTGTLNFLPNQEKTAEIQQSWTFIKDSIEFFIDNLNVIAETSEQNNKLKIYTNSISQIFYVEQSIYNYFHDYQYLLGVGTNSWDDWAQMLHVKRWNAMFQNAVYPSAPNGVLDRIRVDSIAVMPDGALPLGWGLATNHPNDQDHTVDLQWGFPSVNYTTFYSNHTSANDNNPFFFEGSLLHELGHARYLKDNYGFDIHDTHVHLKEGNTLVSTSPLMPTIVWDILYFGKNQALMGGTYDSIAEYEALALNRIAYHRATKGNFNSPYNNGEFLQELPQNNFITFKDQNNMILNNACLKVYRAGPKPGEWYGKNFDTIPDLQFVCNAGGEANVGHMPFDATAIIHGFNHANTDIIIRVEHQGKVGYGIMEASFFNMEYMKGNINNAYYTLKVNMLPCSQFNSTCNCAFIPTNLTENNTGNPLTVYPNPANNSVFITAAVNLSAAEIFVWNNFGEQLNTKQIISKGQVEIFTDQLPSGLYTIEMIDAAGLNYYKKIIIQH
ncbi:MAG: T9SS type A sorting domain-containing protein [Bacteroidetes bacterium]|nr:T9SS type A sorting domain-containing protein [Bacteroidota bacterium]